MSLFPSDPLNGIRINLVDPGTVINGPGNEQITVTEDKAVFKGRDCYVTQKIWDALKKASVERKAND